MEGLLVVFTILLFVVAFALIYGWIDAATSSRSALAELTKRPGRLISEYEQQILYLAHKKKLPCYFAYSISGAPRTITYDKYGLSTEAMVGTYKLVGAGMDRYLIEGEENHAEVVIHKNRAYALSINGHSLTEIYGAEWEARFAPIGKAEKLNIEITGKRQSTDAERRQLKLNLRRFHHLYDVGTYAIITSIAYGVAWLFSPFSPGGETTSAPGLTIFMMLFTPLVAVGFLLNWLDEYRRSCVYGISTLNGPGREVILAKGTVTGVSEFGVWFHHDSVSKDELRLKGDMFQIKSLLPLEGINIGQEIEFGFCANEEGLSHDLVFIKGHLNADTEFRSAPFMLWDRPITALGLGLPLLGLTLPILLGYDGAEQYFDIWAWVQVVAGVGVFWSSMGLYLLANNALRLWRYVTKANATLGSDYSPFNTQLLALEEAEGCDELTAQWEEKERNRRQTLVSKFNSIN